MTYLHGDGKDEKGLISALNRTLGCVRRLSSFPAAAKKLYLTGTFNSKLYYGIETYGALPATAVRQLQCIQNRAALLALPSRNLKSEERIKRLGWLPVNLMIIKASLCLLHKMLSTHPIPYFDKFIGSRRRRFFDPIATYDDSSSRGRLLDRSFLPRTIKTFNSLPESLRKIGHKTFKKKLNAYLLTGSIP